MDSPLTDTERRVLEAVDMDGLVATLYDLIAFQSDRGQEIAVQERMATLLADAGMDVDLWEIDLPALAKHPAYAAEIERERAIGVVGKSGHGQGRSLILNGHVDVVPAGEPGRWTVPPFAGTVRDGRVYGRGSADMKGGVCCALYAVRALHDAGVELDGSVLIQSVAGEEDGGMGTLAAIERGHTADAAIILEPTELIVAPAQGGALSFRITVPGLAAHGALRAEGVDPLERFQLVFGALRKLELARNERLRHPLYSDYEIPYAICVGKVRGGVWASTVAETVVLEGRYGVGIGEDCDTARAELEHAIATAARGDAWLAEHAPVVEWWGARYEPADIPVDHPLVTTLGGAFHHVTGATPRIQGMPYGADMHLLVHHGNTPTVIFGPGDVRTAHAPDEFVPIAELETATRALALTLLRFCNALGEVHRRGHACGHRGVGRSTREGDGVDGFRVVGARATGERRGIVTSLEERDAVDELTVGVHLDDCRGQWSAVRLDVGRRDTRSGVDVDGRRAVGGYQRNIHRTGDRADPGVVDDAQRRSQDHRGCQARWRDDRATQVEIDGEIDHAALGDGEPVHQLQAGLVAAGDEDRSPRTVLELDIRQVLVGPGRHQQTDPFIVAGGQQAVGDQGFATATLQCEQVDTAWLHQFEHLAPAVGILDLDAGEHDHHALCRVDRGVGDGETDAAPFAVGVTGNTGQRDRRDRDETGHGQFAEFHG